MGFFDAALDDKLGDTGGAIDGHFGNSNTVTATTAGRLAVVGL